MRTSRITVMATLIAVGMLLPSMAQAGSLTADGIKLDGIVDSNDGYTQSKSVTFDIENGPTNVAGGTLHTKETSDYLYVGLVLPLNIIDNTFAPGKDTDATTNNLADDWNDTNSAGQSNSGKAPERGLDKATGSEKWEVNVDNFNGSGSKLELKMSYGKATTYDAFVERFKYGGADLDMSDILIESSMDYNNTEAGLSAYFDPNITDSSPFASDGYYNFTANGATPAMRPYGGRKWRTSSGSRKMRSRGSPSTPPRS